MATLIEELDKLRGENAFLRTQGVEPTGFGSIIEGGSQGGLLETLGLIGGNQQEPTPQAQQIPQGGLDELITMQLGGVDEGVSGVATGQTGAESLRFGTPPPDIAPVQRQPQRQVQPQQAPITAQRSVQSREKVTRALARLLRIDPSGTSAKFAQELIVSRNAADLAETTRRMDEVFKETSSLLRIEDPAKQERAILNLINERTTKGLESPKLDEILRMPRRDRPLALQRRKTIATDVKTLSVNEQKELDRESREGIAAAKLAKAGVIGKPSPKDFTPESLEVFDKSGKFADLVAVERPPDRRGRDQFSRGTSFQGRNAAGENVLFTPVLDKFSGKLTVQEDVLPGQLISRIGETPAQTQQRAIETAGGTTSERARVTRLQTTINDGINAAEGLATLNRSLELLKTIKTGGIAGAKLRFEQFLGIQGADEAELGANLLRTVLSQLRPTFGAQFTEREGTKLERIEAGIGKSTKGNIRVLKQLKTIIEREARRGITAAKESKDTFSAEEIDRLMKFKISAPGTTPPPAQSPAPADQASPFTIRRVR